MRYCEAVRTASAFGWYAYPAKSLNLLFDGTDTFVEIETEDDVCWEVLQAEHVSDPDNWWNRHCPKHLIDKAPPFVTTIGMPGYVQIWSGLLIQTKPGWSSLIRPVANTTISGQYFCFEGIVETDHFAPTPLFVNLRLTQTNVPIFFNSLDPLFQVQCVHKSCYSSETLKAFQIDEPEEMTPEDWDGYLNTVRSIDPTKDEHQTGRYATETRKRSKRELIETL